MVKIGSLVIVFVCMAIASGQRITTIQLDGVQYFISRMNPYSPELNYFLAYQYCRSLGLQLASFETKEKVESMTAYLQNAGYSKYDFWTSGNRLGTGMFLWMSTGLQFNATFDYFENSSDSSKAGNPDPFDNSGNTAPQRTARDSNNGLDKGCVILKAPILKWAPEDCSTVKDFICEQTRCYYYNYGSIPVSSAQGRRIISSTTSKPPVSTTTITYNETNEQYDVAPNDGENNDTSMLTIEHETESEEIPSIEDNNKDVLESETVEDEILDHEDAPREMDSQSEEFDEILHEIPEEVIVSDSVGENEKEKQFNLGNSTETANNSSVHPNVFSLTDLINTFRLQDKKIPQIDSDYSNTLRVLGDLS